MRSIYFVRVGVDGMVGAGEQIQKFTLEFETENVNSMSKLDG